MVKGALGTIKKDMENYSNKILGNINIHDLQKINSPFYSPPSQAGPPSTRNPLCLSKSMVWTWMLKEKINRNYTSISIITTTTTIIIIIIIIR